MEITSNFMYVGTMKKSEPCLSEERSNPNIPTDIRTASRQWRNINEKELAISVLTAEGDKVTLSYNVTSLQESYRRSIGTYVPDIRDVLVRSESRDITVEGDLSEPELEEIKAFEGAIMGVRIEFYSNGTDTSSEVSDMDLAEWESLSSVKADFSDTFYKRWEPEMTNMDLKNLPKVGVPADVKILQSLVEIADPFAGIRGNFGTENNQAYGIRWRGELSMISRKVTSDSYDLVNGTETDAGKRFLSIKV